MKKNLFTQILRIAFSVFLIAIFTGCLKTRSEVSPTDQSYIYRKKQQEDAKGINGTSANQTKDSGPAPVDTEELIRTLNGRIEVLENQVNQMQKESAAKAEGSAETNKVLALQDALSKMELQIQKLESEKATAPIATSADIKSKSSDENLNIKKNSFDIAEEFFSKKEWKKAILSYQKFVEEFPKSKQVADAKYKTGVAFQELGLKDEALAFYEEVSVQYPQTAAGKKSKLRSASLSPKASTKNKKK